MRQPVSTLAATGLIALGTLALATLAFAPQVIAHGNEEKADEFHAQAQDGEPHGEDAHHEGGHQEDGHGADGHHTLEGMREMHRGHEHEHDFAAMERLPPEQRDRVLALMRDIGLALPPMNSLRGRHLFLQKGCIACHQVNGVGGDLGPSLNAEDMPESMNAFEFAARMWRGAPAMTALQEQLLGEVITLDGQDLADIIAFAHDDAEQRNLTPDQVPTKYQQLIRGE